MKLLPDAMAGGVAFLPAQTFFLDSQASPDALRVAFSMYPLETLAEGIARLATTIRSALGPL